ncbi:unnamed protein product, partial [Phaeothamnion confervicola]
FGLTLDQPAAEAIVAKTVAEFRLNGDQGEVLWRCARWFSCADSRLISPAAAVPATAPASTPLSDGGDATADQRSGSGGGSGRGRDVRNGGAATCAGSGGDCGAVGRRGAVDDRILLVHGVFGAGKSCTLVALCVLVNRLAVADAAARDAAGKRPRPKEQEARILLAAATNVAVDRVLKGLLSAGMVDIARAGSLRRMNKSVSEKRVHSFPGGRFSASDATVPPMLAAILRESSPADSGPVREALRTIGQRDFGAAQTRRLRTARVTGVTCAASTLPL